MNLASYIHNSEQTIAEEIYNANFDCVSDVVNLMRKIDDERKEFDKAIHDFNIILHNIKIGLSRVAKQEKRLKKLKDFKSSYIAKHIKAFIENNTPEELDYIKKEIKLSNEFGIYISSAKIFSLEPIGIFYSFDKWNIDEDILSIEKDLASDKEIVWKWCNENDKMYDKYGCGLILLIAPNDLKADELLADAYPIDLDDYEDDDDY